MAFITLGGRTIGDGTRPYVIAEIGVNHEGSLDQARRLIELAKEGGADAAKFQSYKAGKIASRHSPAYWDTTKESTPSQHQLFQKYDLFEADDYRALAEHCRTVGIAFSSTPFDPEAVEFLDPLVPFHKIASADLTSVPLLRQVARKGKPVVLSTGASTLAEIDNALAILRQNGCRDIALLHCVLNYPCANANAHLNMIDGLKRAYPELVIGYSDHTVPDDGMRVLTAAWLKGAAVIEKHFTHDKTLPGNDHYHAMDAADCRRFISNVDVIAEALGNTHKAPLESEAPARLHARRSIVLNVAVRGGQLITEDMIAYKRPGSGISPLHWDEVIGMRAATDLPEDHVLHWRDLVDGASDS